MGVFVGSTHTCEYPDIPVWGLLPPVKAVRRHDPEGVGAIKKQIIIIINIFKL